MVDTNVLIRSIRSTGKAGRILSAVDDGCVRLFFSLATWTEFDVVLDRIADSFSLSPSARRAIRSTVLDAAQIVTVEAREAGVRDSKDNMFIDVLDQSEARWLCTDDGDLHAFGRAEIIGIGELVRMIEEVC